MEETLYSVYGWSLQVLWIIILIDKHISSSVATKKCQKLQNFSMIFKTYDIKWNL
jgi:hypothetical protein